MSDINPQIIFNDILEAIESNRLPLPTQPEIAIAIEEAAEDPQVTVGQLNKIIVQDPALTARIIRISNSPLVRGRMNITSLENAISRLGLNFVANMAIGLAMEQLFKAKNKDIERKMVSVWKHSAKVAGVSHILAMRHSEIPTEHATLGGLLHEVGVLPILSYAEKHPEEITDPKILEQIINKTEAKLGEAILHSWQFHPQIAEIPLKIKGVFDEKPAVDLSDIVLVAKILVLQNTNHPLAKIDKKEIPAFKRLGIDPDTPTDDNPELAEAIDAGKQLLI